MGVHQLALVVHLVKEEHVRVLAPNVFLFAIALGFLLLLLLVGNCGNKDSGWRVLIVVLGQAHAEATLDIVSLALNHAHVVPFFLVAEAERVIWLLVCAVTLLLV